VEHRARRRLLVDPKIQYELIAWALLVFVVAAAAFGGMMWFVLRDVGSLGDSLGLPPEHLYFTRLAELNRSAALAFAVTFLGLSAAAIYGGLIRSRRIVGPIQALRRQLDAAAEGNPAPISLRAEDHFADLPGRVNRLVDALKIRRP